MIFHIHINCKRLMLGSKTPVGLRGGRCTPFNSSTVLKSQERVCRSLVSLEQFAWSPQLNGLGTRCTAVQGKYSFVCVCVLGSCWLWQASIDYSLKDMFIALIFVQLHAKQIFCPPKSCPYALFASISYFFGCTELSTSAEQVELYLHSPFNFLSLHGTY